MGKATQIAAVVVTLAMAGLDPLEAAQDAPRPRGAQNAIDRGARESVSEPAQEPARESVEEPGRMPAAETATEPTEGPAQQYVTLKLEGACDERNNRLWLTNTHTYKTIAATIRWRAAGGKELTDQFFPGPNSVREIGCAAEGTIVEATFAAF